MRFFSYGMIVLLMGVVLLELFRNWQQAETAPHDPAKAAPQKIERGEFQSPETARSDDLRGLGSNASITPVSDVTIRTVSAVEK
jgi:hypothetical protein